MRTEKRKVGTILEVTLLKQLKIQAAKENRTMADIIADAIDLYLSRPETKAAGEYSFHKLLNQPSIKASCTDIKAVLEEDIYQV